MFRNIQLDTVGIPTLDKWDQAKSYRESIKVVLINEFPSNIQSVLYGIYVQGTKNTCPT